MNTLKEQIMHNCRVKRFPDGTVDVLVASYDVFREPGWEQSDKWDTNLPGLRKPKPEPKLGESPAMAPAMAPDSLARSKRRARSAVYDLAMCNDFAFFVTLTLDASKVDRYDMGEVMHRVNAWLDNRVRRKGLCYVLVPELHKDGAIHFHGFFNDALPMVDSGTVDFGGKPRRPRSAKQRCAWLNDGGHVVYNVPDWGLGFSTAIELYGERRAACGYVCKYVTKALDKIGGRWYYSGGKLRKPEVHYMDVDFDQFSGLGFGFDTPVGRMVSVKGVEDETC